METSYTRQRMRGTPPLPSPQAPPVNAMAAPFRAPLVPLPLWAYPLLAAGLGVLFVVGFHQTREDDALYCAAVAAGHVKAGTQSTACPALRPASAP
jgi:hypothetical protein